MILGLLIFIAASIISMWLYGKYLKPPCGCNE